MKMAITAIVSILGFALWSAIADAKPKKVSNAVR
jgi:hypothetical protein